MFSQALYAHISSQIYHVIREVFFSSGFFVFVFFYKATYIDACLYTKNKYNIYTSSPTQSFFSHTHIPIYVGNFIQKYNFFSSYLCAKRQLIIKVVSLSLSVCGIL